MVTIPFGCCVLLTASSWNAGKLAKYCSELGKSAIEKGKRNTYVDAVNGLVTTTTLWHAVLYPVNVRTAPRVCNKIKK